jgi:ADP-glucose pyrophosphorylase
LNIGHSPPNFEFYDPTYPIYTYPHFLPPANVLESKVVDAIISPGSEIGHGTIIENAVIGLRSLIGKNSEIRNAMIMGADYFEPILAFLSIITDRRVVLSPTPIGAPPSAIIILNQILASKKLLQKVERQ